MHVSSGILQIIQINSCLVIWFRRVSSFRKPGTLKKSFDFLYWAWWLYTQILCFFHVLCINAARAYVPKCHYDIALPGEGQRGPLICMPLQNKCNKAVDDFFKAQFSCYLNKEHSFDCTYKNLTRYIIKSSKSDTTLVPGSRICSRIWQ